jgi:hypothetical protein
MDQIPLVSGVERVSYLSDNVRCVARMERPVYRNQVFEVDPLHEAHCDIGPPFPLTGLVNRKGVRMVDLRSESRLALETRAEAWLLGQLGQDQFESDLAFEGQLRRAVDGAHPASTDD